MLKCFKVNNYKNFKNTVEIDFGKVGGYKFNQECINSGKISKGIIYGRNATGKTNLGMAIIDIRSIILGISMYFRRKDRILNADSNDKYASFYYEFEIDGKCIVYSYKKNNKNELCLEMLKVDNEEIFSVNFEEKKLNCNNLSLINAETIQLDKYAEVIKNNNIEDIEEDVINQIPLLRFILNNAALPVDSPLLKLEDYVERMKFNSVTQQILRRGVRLEESFTDFLSLKNNLRDFEKFLNEMGVKCELQLVKTVEGHYELVFGYNNLIRFYETASSGTLSLATFYRRYIAIMGEPSFVFMDEFDAFYHYEMAEKLVDYLKTRYRECQVLLTTHNTNLMTNQLMRPDCLFILSRNGRLTALCDATERELREGHNLEKLYIGGEFEKYE